MIKIVVHMYVDLLVLRPLKRTSRKKYEKTNKQRKKRF